MRTIVTLCVAIFWQIAISQVCQGNLGNNIFTTGDFGSGTANVYTTDPGIAPGFIYSTIVPVDDGEYVLTNDMADWPNLYQTWLPIGDNSPGTQGYMMVVNASYSPGIFYQQTIDGLCDNTLYEFSADVINVVRSSVPNHILPNVSFLINGIEEFTTGPVPQDEVWKRYGFTFTTLPGQTEVTLTLRNNAPGGIGNDLALDNISFRACGPTASISIDMEGRVCENVLYPILSALIGSDTGFVQWQISEDLGASWSDIPGATGRVYQSDQLDANYYLFRYVYGLAPQHLQNEKCRIVSATRFLDVVPVNFLIIDTLCEGLSFQLGNESYSETGTYFQHLTAANGCDSLVTLELTVIPDPGIHATLITTPPTCAGYEDGSIVVSNVELGTSPFMLIIDGYSSTGIDVPVSVAAGIYSVQVSDRYGCREIQHVQIEDPIPFMLEIEGDDSVRLGYTTVLTGTGNYPLVSISWQPPAEFACPSCPVTELHPLESRTYTAVAISEEGCPDTASIHVFVDTEPLIYIPNVFSPNGDGINDEWVISTEPVNIPVIRSVKIFDRWGSVLFAKSGITTQGDEILWDGLYENQVVNPGVYTYQLEFLRPDGVTGMRSGSVTVLH